MKWIIFKHFEVLCNEIEEHVEKLGNLKYIGNSAISNAKKSYISSRNQQDLRY